jgi:hypothetical protein
MESDEEYPQLAAAKLEAREISAMTFRYYDGLAWVEEWDSTARNELPKAIEIKLTIRDSQQSSMAFEDDTPDPWALPETIHRMVVPLPLAEPFITEAVL